MRALLAIASARLAGAGVASPRNDAEVLLAHLVGVRRSELGALPDLDAEQRAGFEALIAARAERVPLQHLTGTASFRYLDLVVGPGVFIPRPETELLAGAAIDELRRIQEGRRELLAVDLCTGSGAVAVAMATEVPGTRVIAVELSPEASAYAWRNADGFDIEIRTGDIAVLVDDLAAQVDVVTANPPYIPLEAFESVEAEVRDFDPPLALWSGDDGLDAIRVVEHVAARVLVDDGLVCCEHADVQGEAVVDIFARTSSWAEVRDHHDLAGRSRYVTARRVARDGAAAGTMSL